MAHKASETGVREKTWVRERKLPSLLRTLLWNIEQCAREFDCELCPVNKRCLSLESPTLSARNRRVLLGCSSNRAKISSFFILSVPYLLIYSGSRSKMICPGSFQSKDLNEKIREKGIIVPVVGERYLAIKVKWGAIPKSQTKPSPIYVLLLLLFHLPGNLLR